MTAIKLAEALEAAADASHLLELFDHLGIAVFRVAPSTHEVTLLGRRAAELFGETLSGQRWRVPDSERGGVVRCISEVAQDGKARTIEHRVSIAGRPELLLRTTLFRPKGSSELLGAAMDITTQRASEQHWEEVESWLVTLGDTLPFDFFICDRAGRCLLQNPVSQQRKGNLVGATVEDWQPTVQRALKGETTREERVVEEDGAVRHLVRVVSPVIRSGEVHAALGVDLDVTPLKETEARLRTSMEELAQAQDALVRKRELAALGEMAAVVAHEIRNPLGALSNSVALLSRESALSIEAQEVCRIIRDEVGRLDRLVVALLDLARPLNLDLAPLSLEAEVEEALAHALMTERAKDRVRICRDARTDVPKVRADRLLLQLALTNVLRNAMQAMPDGGDIYVAVSTEDEGEARVARVTISDTGPGIPEAIRDRLFQPFVTSRPTGSGLGLAIVKRIIEEHGGDVELRPGTPRGATCVIRMPVEGPR